MKSQFSSSLNLKDSALTRFVKSLPVKKVRPWTWLLEIELKQLPIAPITPIFTPSLVNVVEGSKNSTRS